MKTTVYFTTIGKGHGAPCLPADQNTWQKIRNTKKLSQLCLKIEKTVNEDRQKTLKSQLPVWTPRCAEFKDNHRAENDALKPLNRLMFDIDTKGRTDEIMAKTTQPKHSSPQLFIDEFPVLLIEESVRRGTHVLVELPKGMDPNEAQARFSEAIGMAVDPAVKNVAGCIYMVPEDHVRYVSPHFFNPSKTLAKKATATKKAKQATGSARKTDKRVGEKTAEYETTYDGIPYATIVEALAEQLGGPPKHGSRNNFIFSISCYLRYVCNDDPEWIMQVLPTYGEDPERVKSTVRSACNRSQSCNMPQIVERALKMARSKNIANGSAEDSLPPEMPTSLPPLIAHLVRNVPEVCRPAVANAVFPALAAHLKGVTFLLIDGTEKEATFMCVTMAKQSSGKSAINKPIEIICADIVERDELNRRREQEWKDALAQKGANKEKPKRPDDLCVQVLVSDMTNAAFVQRMKDAGGKYLYTNLEELDLLKQLQTNGTKDVGKIICLCFDNGMYGQERVGVQSVTARVNLRWNWNAASTIKRGLDFFKGRLTDGTISRINFCTIIPDKSKPFVYGQYDEEYAQALKPFITNLNLANGIIECKEALEMARRMQERCLEEADLTDDEIYSGLAYRAVTIAYMKAMVLYIAHDMTWSDEIRQFAEWSLEYDLWCKRYFFGEKMNELVASEQLATNNGPRNLLDLLPDRFERIDLQHVHSGEGRTGSFMQLLYSWTNRGYVEHDSTTGEYYKTQKYLERHKRK